MFELEEEAAGQSGFAGVDVAEDDEGEVLAEGVGSEVSEDGWWDLGYFLGGLFPAVVAVAVAVAVAVGTLFVGFDRQTRRNGRFFIGNYGNSSTIIGRL